MAGVKEVTGHKIDGESRERYIEFHKRFRNLVQEEQNHHFSNNKILPQFFAVQEGCYAFSHIYMIRKVLHIGEVQRSSASRRPFRLWPRPMAVRAAPAATAALAVTSVAAPMAGRAAPAAPAVLVVVAA